MTHLTPNRRTVLELVGAAVSSSGLSALEADATQTTYLLRQGTRCLPVVPLSGDEPAEALYDYRARFTDPESYTYSSHGTMDLQRENTSIVFLYDGPEGLSLVLVHGKLDPDERGGSQGTGGGSISFRITGLPLSGDWIVEDDNYDSDSNYDSWDHSDGESRIHWTFDGPRTDGGVFRGLEDELRLRIEPAFNEDAALYGEHYTGRIESWQLLSGDRGDPDRHDLALDEPVELLRGTCADLTETESPTETPSEPTETPTETAVEASIEVEILPDVLVPNRGGVVPVVVTADGDLEPSDVARADVSFGPDGVGPTQAVVRGDDTVLFHFPMDETGIEASHDSAELVVRSEDLALAGGNSHSGSDSFRTAGNGAGGDGGGGDDADEDDAESQDDDQQDDDDDGPGRGPPDGGGPPDGAGPPDDDGLLDDSVLDGVDVLDDD
jgi:hypothetical protein